MPGPHLVVLHQGLLGETAAGRSTVEILVLARRRRGGLLWHLEHPDGDLPLLLRLEAEVGVLEDVVILMLLLAVLLLLWLGNPSSASLTSTTASVGFSVLFAVLCDGFREQGALEKKNISLKYGK